MFHHGLLPCCLRRRGCIPLIVQDGIVVEWEEQLPLKEYALRLPLW